MSKKEPLILKIDSREQNPLKFRSGVFDKIITTGLPFADYWLQIGEDGNELPIVFERKSLGDLFGTLTKGHERFKKEILRASENNVDIVLLVEESMKKVAKGFEHSTISGDQILKTAFSLWVRYGLIPVFCEDRRTASRFIEETFTAIARNYKRVGKSNNFRCPNCGCTVIKLRKEDNLMECTECGFLF